MPDGKTARIADCGTADRSDWRIMRLDASGNAETGWFGNYESSYAALEELQVTGLQGPPLPLDWTLIEADTHAFMSATPEQLAARYATSSFAALQNKLRKRGF